MAPYGSKPAEADVASICSTHIFFSGGQGGTRTSMSASVRPSSGSPSGGAGAEAERRLLLMLELEALPTEELAPPERSLPLRSAEGVGAGATIVTLGAVCVAAAGAPFLGASAPFEPGSIAFTKPNTPRDGVASAAAGAAAGASAAEGCIETERRVRP